MTPGSLFLGNGGECYECGHEHAAGDRCVAFHFTPAFMSSLAETLGADLTMAGDDGAIERVREATGGRGADVVIETTGMLPSVASAVRMARSGGRVLLFGIITAKEGALPFYDLYFKELSLVGARVARSEDYPAAIALVERGAVKLAPLVSDVMPLADLDAAVTMLGSDNGARMKVILEHGGLL